MLHFTYKITCKITSKFYIGVHSTENLNDGYFGSGFLLRKSIKKHGKDNHIFEILEFFEDRNLLLERESELVTSETLKNELCLNLKPGGRGGGVKGVKRSQETRDKMSVVRKQKFANGWTYSQETLDKIANSRRGKKHSQETRDKMSETRPGKKLPPFSNSHLEKLSLARKKRVITLETKQKVSISMKEHFASIRHQTVKCHCGAEGGIAGMQRWHFDNCKK